ncbi:MAG: bifunctional phosphopantothenoylcysteine decarboxylase/phosphopantothenate--cysteine ligase CoaBC [Sebaldella sp.]|nr:bifunctional phosphopantothenoylcysteine decarboxylase/phosphopantothenate--cysteine ligase CoaBC [Sebaldella sp.]
MKNILIGVSGGIAAYKVTSIVSSLRKKGHSIKVIMTENATKIISPLAFESLSKNNVMVDMWEKNFNVNVEHVSLADWADIVVVVPATFNIVGKVANGIADDMLSTVISAVRKPVYFALAMNVNMYGNPILGENIEKLKKYGYKFIEADEGSLASGIIAKGRLKKEEEIVEIILNEFDLDEKIEEQEKFLLGKRILITAGRTEEPIDPIRYFSNRSTGKMGYSLAKAAEKLGAEVTVISGPVEFPEPENINVIKVRTAREMYNRTMGNSKDKDIIIATAAVADFRPEYISDNKIKKGEDLIVKFIKNPDILLELGKEKKDNILIGFAAESENLLENAKGKLERKNLDMIVANSVNYFGSEENKVFLLGKDFDIEMSEMKKEDLAVEILNVIKEKFLDK